MGITNDEVLFGRIAVLSKFVNQEQVDGAVVAQDEARKHLVADDRAPHLGTILVSQGHLSEREKRAILQVQKENLQMRNSSRRQEKVFGYLVQRLGYSSREEVMECVQEQARVARLNLLFRIGEVFVSKGYLSLGQVDDVLALQDRFIITCEACHKQFNVVRYEAGTRVKCPECGHLYTVPDIVSEIKAEQRQEAQANGEEAPATEAPAMEAPVTASTGTPRSRSSP